MDYSLRVAYELTAADVEAGVDALVRPEGRALAYRPLLLRAVWILLAVSGALILYLGVRRVPITAFSFVWGALLAVCVLLSRDPDGALRWLRARLTRKLLANRAPGPRTLTVTPAGLEISAGEDRLYRAWTAVRRARATERVLVLDAKDLWLIVPLHALSETERAALLDEVSARLPIGK